MIQARFLPTDGPNSAELLRAARAVLIRAKAESASLSRDKRLSLARRVRALRARILNRSKSTLGRKVQLRMAEQILEGERRYREVVSQAHRDCLDVALAAARQVIGETISADPEPLARKVNAALQQLLIQRPVEILVGAAAPASFEHALSKQKLGVTVRRMPELPGGSLRIITVTGSIELSFEQDMEEIADAARALLEAKIADEGR